MAATEPDLKSDPEIDARLRRLLEPHPVTVDRLVRQALRSGEVRPRTRWWPRLAVAAAVVIVAVLLIPFGNDVPPAGDGPQPPAARLVISNESGYVTVTTAAGSKMIILNGDSS